MAAPAWAPSTATVAALLPQRWGGGAGPTDDTVPSADQVGTVTEVVCAEVLARCGLPTTALEPLAAATAALGAAALVEASFFPEQQDQGSPQRALQARYESMCDLLLRALVTDGRERLADMPVPVLEL